MSDVGTRDTIEDRAIRVKGMFFSREYSQMDVEKLKFSILTPDVLNLCRIFEERGFEIRIVGGAVRDMLMEQPCKDIDLSTTATPEQMISIFKDHNIRYIETGLQHGTITAHINENDYEVTTLRIDVTTDGRHATVLFTDDWVADAERRDLTVNAMSMTSKGILHDYFNGRSDLEHRNVKFVGIPEKRIQEDYLRILRYFRFYGRLALNEHSHDDTTLDVIKQLSHGLKNVAVERIWVELGKILTGNLSPHLIRLIYKLNVAHNIGLPECEERHFEYFERIWSSTQHLKMNPVTLLMPLVDSVDDATALCAHLKLSNPERNLGKYIPTHRYVKADPSCPLKYYQDYIVLKANPQSIESTRMMIVQLLRYRCMFEDADAFEKWIVPKFPVTGADLKAAGLKPGPNFGKVMNALKSKWVESYYAMAKDELMQTLDVK